MPNANRSLSMRVSPSLRSAALVAAGALLAVSAACSDTATERNGQITGTRPVASRENRVFTQRERLGNPLVSEVMIRKAHHQAHNTGMPSTDVGEFTDDVTGFVTGVAGGGPGGANASAGGFLPGLLVRYSQPDKRHTPT